MNKKEYTIKINGVTTSLRDVTKLEEALKRLDEQAGKTTTTPQGSGAGSGSGGGGTNGGSSNNSRSSGGNSGNSGKAKALTDEEKAAKKLADTQKRLAQADSEANRAQIAATQALRERTREVTREIQINELAEGSIAQMGMQLTDLRNEYYNLSEAERENIDIGGQMLTKIQALDAEYKALKESTGDFRDSVGNYEKALGGLEKLDKGLGDVGSQVNGLSSAFAGNNAMMGIFGQISGATEDAQKELAKVIAIVTVAQTLNSAATGENSIAKVLNTAITKTQAIQENARTIATNLATRSTIAATVAQRIFNMVAAANPYVLLALALVAVIGALIAFSGSTESAAEDQKKLNEEQAIWLEYLEEEEKRLQRVADSRIKTLERLLKISAVNEENLKETRKLEDDIYKEKLLQNARLLGVYHREIESLEENRKKLEIYLNMIRDLKLAEARGDNSIELDIDLNGKAEKVDVKEALDIVQKNVDNLNKVVEIGVRLKSEQADLIMEAEYTKAVRAKEDKEAAEKAAEDAKKAREEAKRKADEARKNAQERAALELEAQRAAEDLRLKMAGETLDTQRRMIEIEYKRQQEDLKIRLKNEEKLTTNARKAINAQILSLGKVMAIELAKLDEEIAAKNLETSRLRQDQETALIQGQTDRRIAEIDMLYDRQIDDVRKRLRTEKNLTEQQRKDLNAMVVNYDKQREKEMDALIAEGLQKRASLEIQQADSTLKEIQNRIGDAVKRNETGFLKGVLDVDKTRDNLERINQALDTYVGKLETYKTNLAIAHAETLSTLKEGSQEYKDEVQKFSVAIDEVNQKIRESQKMQKENTKMHTRVMAEYWHDLFAKIAEYADLGATAISSVVDALNMGIQASLDSLNEQLEVTEQHYDEAKKNREKYAEDVVTIEQKVQNATGATAEALRIQLQDAMHQRDEAQREEQRLAREKEKMNAEIAKKEKQMKRNELISKIAMGIANTAQGITQMLTLAWPLNLIMAAIVGVAGAAQVGIMSNQLAKLADGGEIVGPSHANGGVNILIDGKPSYEAQGGEFMVNDKSYAANKGLVNFINDNPYALSAADLAGIVPGSSAVPVTVLDYSGADNDAILDAIDGINFRPVVSVTDINDVTNDLTTVQDLAGF